MSSRLSTIARMDRLIVLDAGRIVEQGTHAELLARGGAYATLWRHQSGGFLPHAAPPGDDVTEPEPAQDDLSAELQSEPNFDKGPRRVEL